MPPRTKKIPRSTRFEEALAELETLVKQLESGDQSLDESLEQFERGVSLARFCQQNLSDASQKVKLLVAGNDGDGDGDDSDGQLTDFETSSAPTAP